MVIGLGASGMAAARFLHAEGMRVAVSESRSLDQVDRGDLAVLRELSVAIETGGHSGSFFRDAALVVPSPGVPLDLPVIEVARQARAAVAG